MKNKGISLIVLVITIIVMIILAATIIISLSNAGIIENASKAVSDTDVKQAQEIAQVAHLEGVHQGLKNEELKTYVINYLKKSGFEDKLDKLTITVTDESVTVMLGKEEKALQSISLDKTIIRAVAINSYNSWCQLNVIYNPEDTTDDKTVTWSSADDGIATVNNSGNVYSFGAGSTTITAKVQDKTATCTVRSTIGSSVERVKNLNGDVLDINYDISEYTGNLWPERPDLDADGYVLHSLIEIKTDDTDSDEIQIYLHSLGFEMDSQIVACVYAEERWIDVNAEICARDQIILNIDELFPDPNSIVAIYFKR